MIFLLSGTCFLTSEGIILLHIQVLVQVQSLEKYTWSVLFGQLTVASPCAGQCNITGL